MIELGKEKLQEYIKSAIDLETDIATQEGIIQRYEEISSSRKPQLVLIPDPEKPEPVKEAEFSLSKDKTGAYVIPTVVGGLLAFVGLCLTSFVADIGIIAIVIGVLMMLPFFFKKKNTANTNTQNKKSYEKQYEIYKEKVEAVQTENEKINLQYNENLKEWENNEQENKAFLYKPLKETKAVLEKLYDTNFIYNKYRNLPALTSIYEYLITGRCDSLSGPYGAYNLYEDEVRKDTVISQLNAVIEHLEQIKQNQFLLYQQVKTIQKEINAVENELNQIKGYTMNIAHLSAINAYYSALTARNTEVTMIYHLLS